jgi:hypothetical protein
MALHVGAGSVDPCEPEGGGALALSRPLSACGLSIGAGEGADATLEGSRKLEQPTKATLVAVRIEARLPNVIRRKR